MIQCLFQLAYCTDRHQMFVLVYHHMSFVIFCLRYNCYQVSGFNCYQVNKGKEIDRIWHIKTCSYVGKGPLIILQFIIFSELVYWLERCLGAYPHWNVVCGGGGVYTFEPCPIQHFLKEPFTLYYCKILLFFQLVFHPGLTVAYGAGQYKKKNTKKMQQVL